MSETTQAGEAGEVGPDRGQDMHRLSVLANMALAALKLGVGALAGSGALVADGLHSLADVGLSTAAWIGYRWSRTPPDDDHHYGHGNGEALAGIVVGGVIVSTGAGLVWAAVIWRGSVETGALGFLAVGVLLVTLGSKLWLARTVGRAGEELGSPSLVAVARDHRSDVLASALVLVAILSSLAGMAWAEPVATAALGLIVLWMGLASIREGFDVLMDRIADPDLRGRLSAAAAGVEGVSAVGRLRVHPLGGSLAVDVEIGVDGQQTVDQGHAIAHKVEAAIIEAGERVEGVQVHVEPHEA